jgi:hypothetical protein
VGFRPSGVGTRTAIVVASGPGFRATKGIYGRGR